MDISITWEDYPMKKYKKQICRVLLIFFASYFLMDTVQNYQNKNYLILSIHQSIQNIVTILPSIEDEIKANQTVADSFDLPTLELISMDFRNSMDELCIQPTFFNHQVPDQLYSIYHDIKNCILHKDIDTTRAYRKIFTELYDSLTDENGNPKKFIFTSSALYYYNKANNAISDLKEDVHYPSYYE